MTAAPAPAPATVHLEQLGHPPAAATSLRLRCVGVPETTRRRLTALGAEVVEEEDAEVDALVISTRLPPDELSRLEARLAGLAVHTVVLAHTGAERLAAQLIEAGADALVGEGNEEALLGLADPTRTPTTLLASFERRFGSAGGSEHGTDPGTSLPDRRSFERRIGSLGDAGEVPRVGFCKVLSERWAAPDPDPIVALQRRRLATALSHLGSTVDTELYATGNGEFGLVSTSLSPHDVQRLGRQVVEVVSTFRDRGLPLRAVIGHAGAESSTDPDELLELARRAVEVAAADGAQIVLSAEDLSLGVSVTTELEAIMRLVDQLEPALPEGRGHGERVGRVAAELGRLRGWSPAAVARTHLAGHLHDVGRTGLPPAAIAGPGDLTGEMLEVWRTFPERSAALLRLTGGSVVAATVRAQRERWDGEGFPDGVRSTDIPEGARVLAVSHVIDELFSSGASLVTIARELRERAGSQLDPELTDLAAAQLQALLAPRV
jgi:HD-GYP domain-containing protein (c-di-GMP phosphodiesterase class II)